MTKMIVTIFETGHRFGRLQICTKCSYWSSSGNPPLENQAGVKGFERFNSFRERRFEKDKR